MRFDPDRIWRPCMTMLDLWVRCVVRLQVEGLGHIPADGPVLLVANHVSFLDPAVLLAVANRRRRKIRFLCVAEAFEKPVLGTLLRAGRQIPVGGSQESRSDALAAARRALGAGEAVLVYPEGTIPRDGADVRPHLGAGMLALLSNVPVVPIATIGLERSRKPWRPWRRPPALVVVGPALRAQDWDGRRDREAYAAASVRCLQAVQSLRASVCASGRESMHKSIKTR